MITILDSDLYKFSMQQAVLHHFSAATAEYTFVCRNKDQKLLNISGKVLDLINERLINHRLCSAGERYLKSLGYFTQDYLDFLSDFTFKLNHLSGIVYNATEFNVSIEGPWLQTILWEVPLLSIISEAYGENQKTDTCMCKVKEKLRMIAEYPGLKFADFGTRRRHSLAHHKEIIKNLVGNPNFIGTSNIGMAMEYNIPCIGTMAHEWIQAGQVLAPSLAESQWFMLWKWIEEYKDQLAIALTDTLGTDKFIQDYSRYFNGGPWKGVRQDSGDPVIIGEKLIKMFIDNRIDPKTKTIVFSDSLTFPKMIELYKLFKDRTNVLFGIGTNLTNDVGYKPLSIVIKLTKINGMPVAKISDDPDKTICKDNDYLQKLKESIK